MTNVPGTSDALVEILDTLKDRTEPATIAMQAATLAAIARFVDAMIEVTALATGDDTPERNKSASTAILATLEAVAKALDTLTPVVTGGSDDHA